LVTFAPGLLGFGLVALLSRVHYARGDARTPAVATAMGWAAVVVADLLLVVALPREWTAAALGIGTSLGMTLTAVWMLMTLRRRQPDALHGLGPSALAALAAAGVGAAAAWLLASALPTAGIPGSVAASVLV